MFCQLTSINGLKQKNSWINDLLQIRVKMMRPTKRRVIFIKNKLFRALLPREGETVQDFEKVPVSPGEIVRIRSKREIRSMLDNHEKYKGCLFIDEMYEHCGKTYKVLKAVSYFFDEARQKMCKCKDTVILEGVVCSGRQRLYSIGCDRNCFFFWHKDWLKKV